MKSHSNAKKQNKAVRSVGKRIVGCIKDLAKRQQTGCHNDNSGGTHNDNQSLFSGIVHKALTLE